MPLLQQGTVFVVRMMYWTEFEHVIPWYFASRVLLRTVNPHLESLEGFPELVMYKEGMLYMPTQLWYLVFGNKKRQIP